LKGGDKMNLKNNLKKIDFFLISTRKMQELCHVFKKKQSFLLKLINEKDSIT